MRKSCSILLFASFFSLIMIISNTVSATSWVELKPQEVFDRAEVIVTGTYDFTSKPKPSEFVFQGLDFNIKNVYKGDISAEFTAGIDYNDAGWADEFQKEGGEFLLFLEKSKDADFLLPVGGPNGMVQVYKGKVEDPNEERRTFFEGFLKRDSEKTMETKIETRIDTKIETRNDSQSDKSYQLLYAGASVLAGVAVLFLVSRYKRKK